MIIAIHAIMNNFGHFFVYLKIHLQGKLLEVGLLQQKVNAYSALLDTDKFSSQGLYPSAFPPATSELSSPLISTPIVILRGAWGYLGMVLIYTHFPAG